jgi:hypothetical protein
MKGSHPHLADRGPILRPFGRSAEGQYQLTQEQHRDLRQTTSKHSCPSVNSAKNFKKTVLHMAAEHGLMGMSSY